MGTPGFAVPTLRALHEAGHDIVAVYTQPPRPAGRGQAPRKSPVHVVADELGLEVRTPARLKGEDEQQAFTDLALDAAIVVAYGLILPRAILQAPRLGCLNVHASLLPRWRGAAPINRAVMAGDPHSGITIMQMDEGLDTGAMLRKESEPIDPTMTAGELHDTLAEIAGPTIVETLAALDEGWLEPEPQPDHGITYADKISKQEARIDWSLPADKLDATIRGLSPFPGAWFEVEINGKTQRVKVLRSCTAEGSGNPGEVLDTALTVACGTGAVQLLMLQREGKKAQQADEFLRGCAVPPGTRLA